MKIDDTARRDSFAADQRIDQRQEWYIAKSRGRVYKVCYCSFNIILIVQAAKFYMSCMYKEIIEGRGAQPFLELVISMGGWEALGNWNKKPWKLNDQILENHYQLSNTVFFTFDVVPKPTDGSLIIMVSFDLLYFISQ